MATLIAITLKATAINIATTPQPAHFQTCESPGPDDMTLHITLGWCMGSDLATGPGPSTQGQKQRVALDLACSSGPNVQCETQHMDPGLLGLVPAPGSGKPCMVRLGAPGQSQHWVGFSPQDENQRVALDLAHGFSLYAPSTKC